MQKVFLTLVLLAKAFFDYFFCRKEHTCGIVVLLINFLSNFVLTCMKDISFSSCFSTLLLLTEKMATVACTRPFAYGTRLVSSCIEG